MFSLGGYQLRAPAICGSVISDDLEGMVAGVAKALEQEVDLIELRLDGLRGPVDWKKLLRHDLPTIVTNRPEREGGRYKGTEQARVASLIEGIEEGAACVDIELSTPRRLLKEVTSAAEEKGAAVLLSYHNLSTTPTSRALLDVARRMKKAGCDIAKIVTFAKEPRDCLKVLDLLVRAQKLGVGMVSFAMGEAGRPSRILAPLFGSRIVYAAVGEATAPGQFDVPTTKRLLRELGIWGMR
ncbi:MAG: type I 3-dehydroquinate dehydratase [Candidatus Hadarchaeales archaeon]